MLTSGSGWMPSTVPSPFDICDGRRADTTTIGKELSGILQQTISANENNRVNLCFEHTTVIARVLEVHPAVLVFPRGSWKKALGGLTSG